MTTQTTHCTHETVSREESQLVIDFLQVGATPESLSEIGYRVAEGATTISEYDLVPPTNEEEESLLQARAETIEPIAERIKPHNRKAHLLNAMKYAGQVRKLRGGVVTTQPTSIEDMELAENALERKNELLITALQRACGACAYSGACRLEGKTEAWLDTHPTPGRATRKSQEPIDRFRTRLDKDPMAHCIPPKNKSK